MQSPSGIRRGMAAVLLSAALLPTAPGATLPPAAARDGQRDFDFELGVWNTRVKRLAKPLSGSDVWLEYRGTTSVRALLDGRANLAELSVEGAAGKIEGVSLRLYDPAARQWSLNFANIRSGVLTGPAIGSFKDGRGEFYSEETFDGRAVLVRFVISGISDDAAHFEQAFSVDGGKTWELNWVADDQRIQ